MVFVLALVLLFGLLFMKKLHANLLRTSTWRSATHAVPPRRPPQHLVLVASAKSDAIIKLAPLRTTDIHICPLTAAPVTWCRSGSSLLLSTIV